MKLAPGLLAKASMITLIKWILFCLEDLQRSRGGKESRGQLSLKNQLLEANRTARFFSNYTLCVAVGTLSSLASPSMTCSFASPLAFPPSTSMALGKLSTQPIGET